MTPHTNIGETSHGKSVSLTRDERHDRVAQNLFEPRAPHVDPDGAHAGNDSVGKHGALVGALVVSFVRTAGIQFFPELELAVLYLIAALVLLVRPTGLFGTA